LSPVGDKRYKVNILNNYRMKYRALYCDPLHSEDRTDWLEWK